MREIKFRGRRKNSSEWVYGAFLAIPKLCSYIYDVQPDGQATRYLVDADTVGQFTGLLDTAQKEIYEGDIVVVKEDGKESRHIVRYMDDEDYPAFDLVPESMSWCGEFNGLSYCMIHMDAAIYVIGNVHDNPELLNEVRS